MAVQRSNIGASKKSLLESIKIIIRYDILDENKDAKVKASKIVAFLRTKSLTVGGWGSRVLIF